MFKAIRSLIFVFAFALCARAGDYLVLTNDVGTGMEDLPLGRLDPNVEESSGGWTGRFWNYSGDGTPAVVTNVGACSGDQCVVLDAAVDVERSIVPRRSDGSYVRVLTSYDGDELGDQAYEGLYFDGNVSFGGGSAAVVAVDGDKLTLWAKTCADGVRRLVVTAGYFTNGVRGVTSRDYVITNELSVGGWHRLTVRTVADITPRWKVPGFTVYVDGVLAVADDDYQIGDDTFELKALSPSCRVAASGRSLFPSMVQGGVDEAYLLSHTRFSGKGRLDEMWFRPSTSPDAPEFVTDENVFTLSWDGGVASVEYAVGDGELRSVPSIDARYCDIPIGTASAVDLRVVATYLDSFGFKEGEWEASGCSVSNVVSGTVTNAWGFHCDFGLEEGVKTPSGSVVSHRDLIAVGTGEGLYDTLKAAGEAARKNPGWPIVLSNDITVASATKQALVVSKTTDDFVLDLCGHTIFNTDNGAPISVNTGKLRIIDTVGGGRIVSTDFSAGYSSKASWAVRVGSSPRTVLAPTLVIAAGVYDGYVYFDVQENAPAPTVSILPQDISTEIDFRSADPTNFYLKAYVVEGPYHFVWDDPYWSVGRRFAVTYDFGAAYNEQLVRQSLPEDWDDRLQFYTRRMPVRDLPVLTLPYHDFLGWWTNEVCYSEVGLRSDGTRVPDPPADLYLRARWQTRPVAGGFVWTGGGDTDHSWNNVLNWSIEGVPGPGDLAIFPEADSPWSVDIGSGAMTTTNLLLAGDVNLTGTGDFSDVLLGGTGSVGGDATLYFHGKVPSALGPRLADDWAGTLILSDFDAAVEMARVKTWGRSRSLVVFKGLRGFVTNRVAQAASYALRLTDDGDTPAWENGYGFTGSTIQFEQLAGDGTLVMTNRFRRESRQFVKFVNVSNYTGRLRVTDKRIVFGDANPAVSDPGALVFASGVEVRSGCDWQASKVFFGETLSVRGSEGDALAGYYESADVSACTNVLLNGASGYRLVNDTASRKVLVERAPVLSAASRAATAAAAATTTESPAAEKALSPSEEARARLAAAGSLLGDGTPIAVSIFVPSLSAGSDYTSLAVTGRVELAGLAASGLGCTLTVELFDLAGNTVATREIEDVTYDFCADFYNLSRGVTYAYRVTSSGDGYATAQVAGEVPMGTPVAWISENAATFAGSSVGTGVWSYPSGAATVAGERIVFSVPSGERVIFAPTNALPACTRARAYRFSAMFDDADSLSIDGGADAMRFGVRLGGTVGGVRAFEVLSNGVWRAVPTTVYAPTYGVSYAFDVTVDDVTSQLVYRVGTDAASLTTLAVVRSVAFDPTAAGDVAFAGCGSVGSLAADALDDRLVTVSVSVSSSTQLAGTNYTAFVARGTVDLSVLHETALRDCEVTVKVYDQYGLLRGERSVTVSGSGSAGIEQLPFEIAFEGLEAGRSYRVVASVALEDAGSEPTVTSDVWTGLARMGWPAGSGWIRENAETFATNAPGTGVWSVTNGNTSVALSEGEACILSATLVDEGAVFAPTNALPETFSSTLREYRFRAAFDDIWFGEETAPAADKAGLTVWASYDDDEDLYLRVISNGTWTTISRDVFVPETGVSYDFAITVDHREGRMRYEVVTNGAFTVLANFALDPHAVPVPGVASEELAFGFAGNGRLWTAEADYFDANIASNANGEVELLEDAIRAARRPANAFTPLWLAHYDATDAKGIFYYRDANGYFSLTTPAGYVVSFTTNDEGLVRCEYNFSDNWIDYADAEGVSVTTNGDGSISCLVLNERGLAWIAAEATNHWVVGDVTLTADLDLEPHDWTPVAGFTGSFDGGGYDIAGLNHGAMTSQVANAYGETPYGLFGTVSNAVFRNLTFSEVDLAFTNCPVTAAGALVGDSVADLALTNVSVASGLVYVPGDGIVAAGGAVGLADNAGLGGELATLSFCGVTNGAAVSVDGAAGSAVAGVVGYADGFKSLALVGNANEGVVANAAAEKDRNYYAAGIATVGGAEAEPGVAVVGRTVTVSDNVNAGVVRSSAYRLSGALGGNVAHILVNSSRDALAGFGSVAAGGNTIDGGVVDCRVTYGDDRFLDDITVCCNFALALATYDYNRTDDTGTGLYLSAVDANAAGVVAVDPYRHTARMSQARFENDVVNDAGVVNDAITSSDTNTTCLVAADFLPWASIEIDRELTLDFGNHSVDTAYADAFVVDEAVTATVANVTVVVTEGNAFSVGENACLTLKNVTVHRDADFYPFVIWPGATVEIRSGRFNFDPHGYLAPGSQCSDAPDALGYWTVENGRLTVTVDGVAVSATKLTSLAKTSSTVILPDGMSVAVSEDNELVVDGENVGAFADYYDVGISASDSATQLKLGLNANALPSYGGMSTYELPVFTTLNAVSDAMRAMRATAATRTGRMMRLSATETREGLYYGLEYKSEADGVWQPPSAWQKSEAEGDTLYLTAPAEDDAGYYRVRVTDVKP